MDFKKQLQDLVKSVKNASKQNGVTLRNEDIAKRLGVSRTYMSDLLGSNADVTEKNIALFKERFRDELAGIVRPSEPGDQGNRERALIRVLMQRVAKLESERLGIPVELVMKDLEQDTMIAWRDLEQDEGSH